MQPARQPRFGFTLVELLVVIAIIGLLINLLLPAVQQAREAARRLQCANNMKQISLAVLNYESSLGSLPAAGTFDDPESATYFAGAYWRIDIQSGTQYGWLVSLLPYLEEGSLYDQFDFRVPVTRNPLHPQETQLESLFCPSDGTAGRTYETQDPASGQLVRFGKANYAAFTNPFHADSWFHPGAIWLYGQGLRRIIDGTSSTLVLAEIRTRDHLHDQRGAWALPWPGASILSLDLHPLHYPQNPSEKVSDPYIPNPISFGATQVPNGTHGDVLYECPEPVEARLDDMPCNAAYAGYISAAPRSLHPWGVNAAFLDGHVTFLVEDVDEVSMAYMINPMDENVIAEKY